MVKSVTLDYCEDDGWFIGRLKEVPSVMSQGETLEELEANIRDAYSLMMKEAHSQALPFDIAISEKQTTKTW